MLNINRWHAERNERTPIRITLCIEQAYHHWASAVLCMSPNATTMAATEGSVELFLYTRTSRLAFTHPPPLTHISHSKEWTSGGGGEVADRLTGLNWTGECGEWVSW